VGQLDGPVHETVYQGLKTHMVPKIEDDGSDAAVGWTSFESPYSPDFESYSFVFGTYMVFALRIDKKSIPPKLIQKHYVLDVAKHLANTGRHFLSGNEKNAIKEKVFNTLVRRIPSTPNVYDLVWEHDTASLWFFSNLKAANEVIHEGIAKPILLGDVEQIKQLIAENNLDLEDITIIDPRSKDEEERKARFF